MKTTIDWHGNRGYAFPAPGTREAIKCGACNVDMKVKRNAIGPTSFAESVSNGFHMHDYFTCPNLEKIWHKQICKLKIDIYLTKINRDPFYDEKKLKARKKITKLLERHLAR